MTDTPNKPTTHRSEADAGGAGLKRYTPDEIYDVVNRVMTSPLLSPPCDLPAELVSAYDSDAMLVANGKQAMQTSEMYLGMLAAKDAEIARLRLTEAENYGVLIEEMRHAWRPQPSSFVRFEEIEAFIRSMGTHRVASSLRADYETALHETRIFWAAAIDEMKKQYADLLRNNERLVIERDRSEWAKGIVDSVARENTGLLQDAQAQLAAAQPLAEIGRLAVEWRNAVNGETDYVILRGEMLENAIDAYRAAQPKQDEEDAK